MKARALRFDAINADLDEVSGRTRWTMTTSVVVHALLLALILIDRKSVV